MHAAVLSTTSCVLIDMHHGHFSKKNKDRTHVRTGTYSFKVEVYIPWLKSQYSL